MFGIKKIQNDLEALRLTLLETKALIYSTYQMQEHHAKENQKKLDAQKVELSVIKTKFHDLGEKISPYAKSMEKMDKIESTMTEIVFVHNRRFQQTEDVLITLNQIIETQKHMMDFMETQDKINQDLIAVIENYAPVKKVPKLPKTKTATTDRT